MRLRLSICLVLTTIFSTSAWAGAGKLVQARGEVWVQPPGANEQAGKAGVALEAGTRVRTGQDGNAEVLFGDGSRLKIKPSSSLLLSGQKRTKKKNSVLLFFGRVWSKVTKSVGGDNRYEVNTPNAVCGVRGTEFETAVADDGSVRVRVSEGEVGVGEGGNDKPVGEGQQIDADEQGVAEAEGAGKKAQWEKWEQGKRDRLREGGKDILDRLKNKVMHRKDKVEALRERQKEIEAKRKQAEARARRGDQGALDEIRGYNQELARIADAIADLGDQAGCQFGIVDHFADLAGDPRFRMVNRKYIEAEAASLRRVKAMFDKMVAEGTDISMEAMDKMLDDLSEGDRGSLRDKKGSAVDDLFGGDEMDMR